MMAQVGAAEGLSGDASDAPGASGGANAPAQDMASQDQANGSGDDASAFPAKGGKGAKGQGGFGNKMMDYAQMQTPQRIVAELSMAKIDRAVYSERQLYEQMVDFWFNHFNVFAGKGVDRWMLTSYERDAIRPHAMGKFRDLLEATAKSPAMLFYLDNWQSVDPRRGRAYRRSSSYGRGGIACSAGLSACRARLEIPTRRRRSRSAG